MAALSSATERIELTDRNLTQTAPTDESRILGIDPGLNTTGYGVLAIQNGRFSLVEAGVVRSKRSHTFEKRIESIYDGIIDVIRSLQPTVIGIEELYSHYGRPQTAIIMGHARGAICLAAAKENVPLKSYAATQIKKVLTGNGRAPKNQVQLAVARQLNLSEPPEPADVADALAIAMCHFYLAGQTTVSN